METNSGSTLLSADCQVSTTGDVSKKHELLESNNQSSMNKSLSNIRIADLIDAAVAGLKPKEARLKNVKGNSCQIISVFESDAYDSDEILSLDSLPADDEEIPLELELSLLSDDSKEPLLQNAVHSSTSANLQTPDLSSNSLAISSPASSNLDTNNNISLKNQTLTVSGDKMFFLEAKTKFDTLIHGKSEQKVSNSLSPQKEVVKASQGFGCANPCNRILAESHSNRTNHGYSDSMQNSAILNKNISDNTSKSAECDLFKDSTIDENHVWSESLHKSKLKSADFSRSLCREISDILKDCNDNVFLDLELGKDVLPLEPLDVKGNVETSLDSMKTNLHDPQAELKSWLKENSWPAPCSDHNLSKPCIVSQSQDTSGLNFQLDLMEKNRQSIQKGSSLPHPKTKNSQHFVPAQDFKRKATVNKNSQAQPRTLISMTTLEGDRIKVFSDNTAISPKQDRDGSPVQVSLQVKSQLTSKKKVLEQRSQNYMNIKPVKCSPQCEDSVIVKDLKDLPKIDKAIVSTTEETSLELSGNLGVMKSCFLGTEEYSTECSVIKYGNSLNNSSDVPKVKPGDLLKDSNSEPRALICQDLVSSTSNSQLPNFQNKSVQTVPLSILKPLKFSLQDQNLQVDNLLMSSNYTALTSDHTSLNSSMSRRHTVENCTEDKMKEPKESLKSFSESSHAKTLQKMKEEPLLLISVSNDCGKPKRIVKLGNQLKEGDNAFTPLRNCQVFKSLNEDNKSVTGKEKCGEELQIKATQNSNTNCRNLSGINCVSKNIVQPENLSKSSDKDDKPINAQPAPTKCSSQTCNTATSKKCVQALIALSEGRSLPAQPLVETVNTQPFSTKCSTHNCNTVSCNPSQNNVSNNAITTRDTSALPTSVADRKAFGKNSTNIPQKTTLQPCKVSKGVKKKRKSKASQKRAKALIALSGMSNSSAKTLMKTIKAQSVLAECSSQTHNTATSKKCVQALIALSEGRSLPSRALVETVNTQSVPIKYSTQTSNTATSKPIPNTGSSNPSLQQICSKDDVSITAEDPMSKRKFIKAKRVWDKQKQLSSLLDGEDCLDERQINDRVQWVCRRWNVKTLSNQELNLTTAAYIRRQLPSQTAACFQGCLEGQKDYTLAIVGPNRKRRLCQDDDDDSTNASDSLGQATKKRRLSQNVQLIPGSIKDLQPDMKLCQKQLLDKLSASQNMSLAALKRKKNEELNMLNEQYHYMQYCLQQKWFQQPLFLGYMSMYQVQSEHDYQQQQLNWALQNKRNYVIKNFEEEEKRLRSQYKTNVEKMKSVLSEGISDSNCLTVALRKGPSRMSNYKITYQTVNLSSHVALAIIREDEIYDSFYSHKV